MDFLSQFTEGTDALTNILLFVGSVVGIVATRWINSKASANVKASRFGAVYDAILAGAALTYRNVYKDLKDKAADGKISGADIAYLSRYAREQAIDAANDTKLKNAVATLADAEWQRLLQKAVGQLKREGGATQ